MKKLPEILLWTVLLMTATGASAEVTFFEGRGFTGVPLTVQRGIADFRAYDYNDRAMSLIVEGAPVEVCEHVNFGGNCQVFNPGHYPRLGPWSHAISSVRPAYAPYGQYPRGYYHERHEHYGYPNWDRESWNERRYRYGGY